MTMKVAGCPGATTRTGTDESPSPATQATADGHSSRTGVGLVLTVSRTTALVSFCKPLKTSTKYSPAWLDCTLRMVRSGGTGFSIQAGPQPVKLTSRGTEAVAALALARAAPLKYHWYLGRGRPVARTRSVTSSSAST